MNDDTGRTKEVNDAVRHYKFIQKEKKVLGSVDYVLRVLIASGILLILMLLVDKLW